jgi:hypothetical protein
MQVSTNPNEKPLPQQILRRSAAVQAHLDAKKTGLKTDPMDPQAAPGTTGANGDMTTADTAPVNPVKPTDPRGNDIEYWRQRSKTMEGRLSSQKDAYQQNTSVLTQQISELKEQIRTLEAQVPAAPVNVSEFLTEDQIQLLGKEEAELIVTTVLKGAQQQVAQLVEREIKPLRDAQTAQSVGNQEEMKQKFLAALERAVPDFAEIDQLPDFHAWLADEDANTGLPRQEAMDTHIGRANAAGVVKMFNAFKATRTRPPAPPVAPNGSGAGPSGMPQAKPDAGLTAPTAQETKDFFKRKATLRKGEPGYVTDQEALAFEKRLKLSTRRQ